MTINVVELRQHLAWFDEEKDVVAINEKGERFEIVKVGDSDKGEVTLMIGKGNKP